MKNFPLKNLAMLTCSVALLGNVHAEDTLKKIKDSGSITMGVREASGALSFTLGHGIYTGFHYEVCQKVIADIQKHLSLAKLEVRYQTVTPANRIPLVQNGTVDLECGTTTNTAARQQQVAFAPSLYIEHVRMAVKANSGITGVEQLAGKTVTDTAGSTSVQMLRKYARSSGADFKELSGKDNSESFLLLESGRADAAVMDGQILAALISSAKKPEDFKILGALLSVDPISIMMRKDDPAFKKVVDESVLAIAKSGEAAKLYDKWLMQPIPPGNRKVGLPASDLTKAAWANPSDKPAEAYTLK